MIEPVVEVEVEVEVVAVAVAGAEVGPERSVAVMKRSKRYSVLF